MGGRTTAMGYQAGQDGFNPKYAGQMRDPESRLDFMHARYYSPEQGRFVSPDPENAGADARYPQTWNGYAYVGNNPLLITDPSGEGWLTWLGVGLGIAGAFFGNPELAFIITSHAGAAAAAAPWLSFAGTVAVTTDRVMNGQPPGVDLLGSTDGITLGELLGNVNTGSVITNANPVPTVVLQQQLDRDRWIARMVGLGLIFTGPGGRFVGQNAFMYFLTRHGGKWDYKNQPELGAHPELDDYGNCHYGVVGQAVGLPDWYTRWAAGVNSWYRMWKKGKPIPETWGHPWSSIGGGDNPANQTQIRRGQQTGSCLP